MHNFSVLDSVCYIKKDKYKGKMDKLGSSRCPGKSRCESLVLKRHLAVLIHKGCYRFCHLFLLTLYMATRKFAFAFLIIPLLDIPALDNEKQKLLPLIHSYIYSTIISPSYWECRDKQAVFVHTTGFLEFTELG